MGSAAPYQLAKAGARVLGIDRFAPPHVARLDARRHADHPAGHRRGRRVRPARGPLARAVARDRGRTCEDLLTVTGGVVLGPPRPARAARRRRLRRDDHRRRAGDGLEHEVLDGAAARERVPPFALSATSAGSYEPSGGFVRPERAVAAQLRLAREHGAEIAAGRARHRGRRGRSSPTPGTYTAGHVVLSAGAWLAELATRAAPAFTVTRQALHWFELDPGARRPPRPAGLHLVTGDGPRSSSTASRRSTVRPAG